MTLPDHLTPSSLAGMLGRSSLSEEELADLRRRAWTEQGVFIVQLGDGRLTKKEVLELRCIARRLYGREDNE